MNLLDWPGGMHEVADGVFAFIQPNGPHGNAGWSNAGLVVGDEYCAVIDTLGTNDMQMAFVDAIRKVTSKPVSRVLLTHHHSDHVFGIHRFRPSCVIAHRACRHNMVLAGPGAVQRWAAKRPHFASQLNDIPIILPDLTFQDQVTVHVGSHEILFFHPGIAHTDGDAAALLAKERVLFAGDLFFNRVCPAAFAGSLGGWIAAVEHMLQLDIQTIVPGHGPVSDKAGLGRMLEYLRLIVRYSQEAYVAGVTAEEVAASMPIGEFREWADTDERLLEDVRKAYTGFALEEARALPE
ncbi:MAG: MBL fold metallo-hydrolase [Ramlibacter sp.]